MFAENTEYEIMTPSGWQDFKGITCAENKKTFRIHLQNNLTVEATEKHYFFSNNKKVRLAELAIGDEIDTVSGSQKIIDIVQLNARTVYDVVEVGDASHQFVINGGIITKNCDEFAYVRPTIAKGFWTSITPTLSTGGKAIITSTPNSDEDQFALIWKLANKCIDEYGNTTELGTNGFRAFRAYWHEHPDRDEKWAAEQRAQLGDERFEREIGCEFIIDAETLINAIRLADLEGKEPIEKQAQVRWYKKPSPDNVYCVALDPSLGTGGDPAAIQVYELPSLEQVAEWQHNKTPVQQQVKILREIVNGIAEMIGSNTDVYYSLENNTLGEAALVCVSELGEETFRGIFLSEPQRAGHVRRFRKGFNTTNKSKLAACSKLKNLIETKRLTVYSKNLISELKTYVAHGTSFAAKPGETDDLVSATLLVVRMLQLVQSFDARIDQKLQSEPEEFIEPLPFILIR